MQGRMSRLRRSLSRSVLQLQAVQAFSRSNGNLADHLPSGTHDEAAIQLVQKFATPSTFVQLRQTVQGNNEVMREIINVFDEKVALDMQYSRGLHKLAARLHKLTQKSECEIDKGWKSVAEQFDVHATIHSNLASAVTDDIVQPLRAIQLSEEKSIRATGLYVEKQLKKLTDKKADTIRAKRHAYTTAKELEKLEQLADADRNNLAKYENRRKKLQDGVKKSEEIYLFESIDQEKHRSQTEKILRRAVVSLEAIERQRLAHTQTALGRLQRKIDQLGPTLTTIFERQTNNLDAAVNFSATAFISSLAPTHAAINTITLTDTYAENQAEIMRTERRKKNLERLRETLDCELQRMYAAAQPDDVSSPQITLLEYVEYLYFKVSETLSGLNGNSQKGYHRLALYQHHLKDKMGLPQTVLTIPLSVDLEGSEAANGLGPRAPVSPPPLSPSSAYPMSSFSPLTSCNDDNYEDYEKISDEGFYNSSSRHTRTLDEPSTPGTIEVATSMCRVLYDFHPTTDDEISLRAGECVLVEGRLSSDWLRGHIVSSSGQPLQYPPRSGRFPSTYVDFCC